MFSPELVYNLEQKNTTKKVSDSTKQDRIKLNTIKRARCKLLQNSDTHRTALTEYMKQFTKESVNRFITDPLNSEFFKKAGDGKIIRKFCKKMDPKFALGFLEPKVKMSKKGKNNFLRKKKRNSRKKRNKHLKKL